MTITRDMLEQAAQEDGVFERAMLPVQKALDAAGLTMVFSLSFLASFFLVTHTPTHLPSCLLSPCNTE